MGRVRYGTGSIEHSNFKKVIERMATPLSAIRAAGLASIEKAIKKDFSLWEQPAFTMSIMHCRSFLRLSVPVAALILLAASLSSFAQRGRKYKAPPPTGRIEVTVLRDVDGKPIENASVIFHLLENGKDKGNMELKTSEEGKSVIDVLPVNGTVRMQIIAHGYQTYGEDYQIAKPDMSIEIRMKRPGEQYSIYKPHPEASEGGKDSGPRANPPAPAAPAAPDKPAAPDAQPAPPPAK